jgi:hypothetical protein
MTQNGLCVKYGIVAQADMTFPDCEVPPVVRTRGTAEEEPHGRPT